MNKPDINIIRSYIKVLIEKNPSVNEIKRKISSVDKFIDWAHKRGYIEDSLHKQLKSEIANYKKFKIPLLT